MSQKIKPGHVLVEVVEGVEGPSLSIGDNDTGERVAGPKPWGGGRTSHCFQVSAKDLIRLAKEYAGAEPSAPKCKACGDTGVIDDKQKDELPGGHFVERGLVACKQCEEPSAPASFIACHVDQSCGQSAPVERDERAAFERAVLAEWPQAPVSRKRDLLPKDDPCYGDYCDEPLQRCWVGWRMRAWLEGSKPTVLSKCALCDQLQADLTARDEQIDALSLDAGRYRWLRDPDNQCAVEDDSDYYMPPMICGYAEHEDVLTCEALDKAIDQAMAKEAQP